MMKGFLTFQAVTVLDCRKGGLACHPRDYMMSCWMMMMMMMVLTSAC